MKIIITTLIFLPVLSLSVGTSFASEAKNIWSLEVVQAWNMLVASGFSSAPFFRSDETVEQALLRLRAERLRIERAQEAKKEREERLRNQQFERLNNANSVRFEDIKSETIIHAPWVQRTHNVNSQNINTNESNAFKDRLFKRIERAEVQRSYNLEIERIRNAEDRKSYGTRSLNAEVQRIRSIQDKKFRRSLSNTSFTATPQKTNIFGSNIKYNQDSIRFQNTNPQSTQSVNSQKSNNDEIYSFFR